MNFLLSKPLVHTFVTEGWGHQREGRLHAGLDLRAPVGTPALAAHAGTVFFAGQYADGSGGAVELDRGDGLATRYLHLSKVDVKKGQSVAAGTQLGLTGHAVSPHLHFDTWILPTQVPLFIAQFGTPGGGITQSKSVAGRARFKVPSEPLVPIDQFQDDVIAMMQKFGIKQRGIFSGPLIASTSTTKTKQAAGIAVFGGLLLAGVLML